MHLLDLYQEASALSEGQRRDYKEIVESFLNCLHRCAVGDNIRIGVHIVTKLSSDTFHIGLSDKALIMKAKDVLT